LLYRTWIAGDDPRHVARVLRQHEEGITPRWIVPPFPSDAAAPRRFRVTIADLGSFEADTFPAHLEAWCRATLDLLGQPSQAA
jgi:hypothetical protein